MGAALKAAPADALPAGFVDEVVVDGLSKPVAVAAAPDGRFFVTEQAGSIRVIKNGALLPTPFAVLTVDKTGERGLLGITLDPAFASNHRLYVFHTVPGSPAHNRITRLTAAGDVMAAGSAVALFDLGDLTDSTSHNGGALRFGNDGKLYVTVGDNQQSANALSLSTLKGKVLRLNPDGTIPADNPSTFRGVAGSSSGINRAIWAVGLRNPFALATQRASGQMFVNDVGESAFEEIDRLAPGANYGWPAAEGTGNDPSLTNPLFAYGHSTGTPQGCAVTGGTFYDPAQPTFPPAYVGRYFFTDFCAGWIYSIDPAAPSAASPFQSGLGGLVDLAVGADGALYYLARGFNQLGRIRYLGASEQAVVVSPPLLTLAEGTSTTVTVQLAKAPATTIRVGAARLISDSSVTRTPSYFDFSPSNWNKPKTLTITAGEDSDLNNDGASLNLSASGILPARIVVTATDNDRPLDFPSAVISMPRNGDTVSGKTAEFFGDARGAAVKAQFYVDGVLRYTDRNTAGHYHINGEHNRWDTTLLANGVHVLLMRVTDATGKWGTHRIKVTVAN